LLNNTEQVEIRAKIVIGADGVESRVGRWAGLDTTCKLQDMESAAQMTLTNIDVEPDTCYFYFGEKVAPGGYLWVFPKGKNTANVGIGIAGIYGRQRHALSYLEEFIEKNFPGASILTVIAGGVPCAKTAERIVTKGLMLVGDAAHQVNPVSGGGIISGMIGGKLAGQIAGQAIKEKNLDLIFKYQEEWHKVLGQRHERYYKIKQFIYKFSDEKLNQIADELEKVPYEKLTLKTLFMTAVKAQPSLLIEVAKLFL
jgi:digeranylgeranylglycerophospholipid reductase